MKIKYALCPGMLNGKRNDITAEELAKLYKVKMEECIVVTRREYSYGAIQMSWKREKDILHLYPRDDGNYDVSRLKKKNR